MTVFCLEHRNNDDTIEEMGKSKERHGLSERGIRV